MKRKYRSSLEFVESGFRACWRNALDLLRAARLQLDAKQPGVALSLSVLAMEEVGKMMFLDGLLFSRPGDHKDEQFRSGHRKHQWKLRFLDLFPLFLRSLAMHDSRYGNESAYNQALAVTIHNLKNERAALVAWLGESCDLTELDNWKQRGLYASADGERFLTPQERISGDFARAVYTLACRFTTTIDFLLEGENIDSYFDFAREIRAKLSEADHQLFESLGREAAEEMSGDGGEHLGGLEAASDNSTTVEVGGREVRTLRDILPESPGLRALFVGKTPSTASVAAGHYFQGHQGRMFWNRLIDYRVFRPTAEYEDDSLLNHGFGMTDIVKVPRDFGNEPSDEEYAAGVDRIIGLIRLHKPTVLIFVYKRVLDQILKLSFRSTARSRYGFNDDLDHHFGARVFVFPMPGTPCTSEEADAAMRELVEALS